jgi:Ca2+-transporting ATPase
VARAIGLVENGDALVIHGRDVDAIMERDGFPDAAIFARVSPRQKLDLVDALQARGVVVAMTGDGVNDAPALQRADIGVAMGQRGTQVAQDASDIVLLDDAFGTILVAVEEGRTIFRNIRAFVRYLLACNVAEVMVVGIATLGGMPLPLLPLQILFLNLVTDVFPALALGMSEAEEDVLERPPRPAEEPILTRAHWTEIVGYSGVIAGTVLGAFLVAVHALDYAASEAVTISFLTLAVAQLVHVFNMRSCGTSFVRNAVTHNPHVWAAVALCIGILLLAIFVPPIAGVLSLVPPTAVGWVLVLLASTTPVLAAGVLRCALFGRTDDR